MASLTSVMPAGETGEREPSDVANASHALPIADVDISMASDAVTHVDVVVRRDGHQEDDCRRVVAAVRPSWQGDELRFIYFDKGITNTLIGVCRVNDADRQDLVLLRVYGVNTDIVINRADEKRNMLVLYAAGCAPPLYASFTNGLAYGYVSGVPIDREQVRDATVSVLIAGEIARFHSISLSALGVDAAVAVIHSLPPVFGKMRAFLDHYPTSVSSVAVHKQAAFAAAGLPPRDALCAELSLLEDAVGRRCAPDCRIVFCHNDLLLNNILYDHKSSSVAFIDFEYGGPNPDAYDIANHFCEYAGVDEADFSLYPARDYQLVWLREYLGRRRCNGGGVSDPADLERFYAAVNKYALCSHFFWGLWSVVQAQHSLIDFDYASYGAQRFAEYFARKDEFLAL